MSGCGPFGYVCLFIVYFGLGGCLRLYELTGGD